LAAGEDHVRQAVKQQERDQPNNEQEQGDRQIAESGDMDIDNLDRPDYRIPQSKNGEQDSRESNNQHGQERPHASEGHVTHDNHQAKGQRPDDAQVIAGRHVQARLL
jgi:hypothetical protein